MGSLPIAQYPNITPPEVAVTATYTGANAEVVFGLRRAIAEGIVPGPRIVAAGNAISGTGGHADNHGYRQEILDLHPSPGICNGADDCRRALCQTIGPAIDPWAGRGS